MMHTNKTGRQLGNFGRQNALKKRKKTNIGKLYWSTHVNDNNANIQLKILIIPV